MSDYDVGYGKPPMHSRFKKNTSGNPGGRPGKRGAVDALAILQRPVVVPMADGRKRKLNPFEIGLERLAKKAMKGDFAAVAAFLEACWAAGLMRGALETDTHQYLAVAPKEWLFRAWTACYRTLGPPPWQLPLDGLIPAERVQPTAPAPAGSGSKTS